MRSFVGYKNILLSVYNQPLRLNNLHIGESASWSLLCAVPNGCIIHAKDWLIQECLLCAITPSSAPHFQLFICSSAPWCSVWLLVWNIVHSSACFLVLGTDHSHSSELFGTSHVPVCIMHGSLVFCFIRGFPVILCIRCSFAAFPFFVDASFVEQP